MMYEPINWGTLILSSDKDVSNDEDNDVTLDLDSFQFWFELHPNGIHRMITINLTGNNWEQIKDHPLVQERSK